MLPDEPSLVEQLCTILLLFISNNLPSKNDNSFPKGYCDINVSISSYFSIEFSIILSSIVKYSLISFLFLISI